VKNDHDSATFEIKENISEDLESLEFAKKLDA
jgi:hypothetical protein